MPPAKLSDFIDHIRPLLRETGDIDLLNITLRKVRKDEISELAYAREDVFGLVFLFHYPLTQAADKRMAALTQRLVEEALFCRGTYYLPYRPHATVTQFHQAYPRYAEFVALKQKYDPQDIFQNDFYHRYLLNIPSKP